MQDHLDRFLFYCLPVVHSLCCVRFDLFVSHRSFKYSLYYFIKVLLLFLFCLFRTVFIFLFQTYIKTLSIPRKVFFYLQECSVHIYANVFNSAILKTIPGNVLFTLFMTMFLYQQNALQILLLVDFFLFCSFNNFLKHFAEAIKKGNLSPDKL